MVDTKLRETTPYFLFFFSFIFAHRRNDVDYLQILKKKKLTKMSIEPLVAWMKRVRAAALQYGYTAINTTTRRAVP